MEEKKCVKGIVMPFSQCPPPCEGLYLDFERSEANLREDMAAKNDYFMQKYKDYTRLIGNSSEDAEESEEGINGGGYTYVVFSYRKKDVLF